MPPEGYDTVTLPESLIERLDELDGGSYTATIRMLVGDHKTDSTPLGDPKTVEVAEELNQLRRELDEFKHDMPGQVVEELR